MYAKNNHVLEHELCSCLFLHSRDDLRTPSNQSPANATALYLHNGLSFSCLPFTAYCSCILKAKQHKSCKFKPCKP